MNTSQYSAGIPSAMDSTDPELGQGDLRVFWLAALVAILAVSAVVFFKMGRPDWQPATLAQTSTAVHPAAGSAVQPARSAAGPAGEGAVVRQ